MACRDAAAYTARALAIASGVGVDERERVTQCREAPLGERALLRRLRGRDGALGFVHLTPQRRARALADAPRVLGGRRLAARTRAARADAGRASARACAPRGAFAGRRSERAPRARAGRSER